MRHTATTLAGECVRPLKKLLLATCALTALILAPVAHADRLVLLVDNSGSMRTNDAERLVPEAVLGFVADLPATTEVALVAFDASASLLAPLSPARRFDPRVLDKLDYRGQFTDPAAAVERGLYELRERTPSVPGKDAMVLITDGVIDLGSAAASLRAEDWLLNDLSGQLAAAEVSVWAIALTEAADFRMLSRLTGATGGRYYRALAARDVPAAIRRIGAGLGPMIPATATIAASRPAPAAEVAATSANGRDLAAAEPETAATAPVSDAAVAPPKARPEVGITATRPAPRSTDAGAARPSVAGTTPGDDAGSLRFWLAFAFLAIGIGLLAWVSVSTWRDRKPAQTREEPALEYFPDCYIVDLHGVTDRPTHRLSGKYNMITRLQNPPDDGINYVQVFRRQIGRRHALIEYRDFSFWIIDQNSLNGTFLNGKRLTSETRLKHGDRLRFHIFEFEFCVSDLALSNETLEEHERAASR